MYVLGLFRSTFERESWDIINSCWCTTHNILWNVRRVLHLSLTITGNSTEIGSLTKFVVDPNSPDYDWQYFQISPHHEIKRKYREDRPELFEPIVKVPVMICLQKTY